MPAMQERSVAQGMLGQGHSRLKVGRGWVDGGLPGSREMGLAAGRAEEAFAWQGEHGQQTKS